jgi:hypothetical protein
VLAALSRAASKRHSRLPTCSRSRLFVSSSAVLQLSPSAASKRSTWLAANRLPRSRTDPQSRGSHSSDAAVAEWRRRLRLSDADDEALDLESGGAAGTCGASDSPLTTSCGKPSRRERTNTIARALNLTVRPTAASAGGKPGAQLAETLSAGYEYNPPLAGAWPPALGPRARTSCGSAGERSWAGGGGGSADFSSQPALATPALSRRRGSARSVGSIGPNSLPSISAEPACECEPPLIPHTRTEPCP